VNGPASRLLVAVAAGLVAAIACRSLTPMTATASWSRRNFRGATVSLIAGPIFAFTTVAGLFLLAVADGDARRTAFAVLTAAGAAGLVGWYDDTHGETHAKGLRGHARALARGRVTSGVLKVAGLALAGACAAAIARAGIEPFVAVEAMVVAGAANLVNLFDLRPGRALKVGLIAAVPMAVLLPSTASVAVAVPAGAAAGVLPFDVREHVMLGDCGANALGAALGAAVVAAQNAGATLAVLVAIVVLTLISEAVSYSRIIDSTPPLRAIDRLGRLPDAFAADRDD
jgi:UDP-GlcNAc:undecaprenyl-phosphate/decaprenyl-phosphate GlcNAc-1-phosphate transferase